MAGPLNWFGLDETVNSLCSKGKYQSPINILTNAVSAVSGKEINFSVDSYPHGAELENLGSTVEVPANGTLTRDGKQYVLRQFHVHTPSEHHIDGEHFAMELHFVFEAGDRSLSVLAVPVDVGDQGHPLLQSLFDSVGDVAAPGSVGETGPLDFQSLEQHVKQSSVYQYEGSLTTPPCSESIKWNVVGEPIWADLKTFQKVKKVVKFNARYTQNVGGEPNLLDYARTELDAH